MRGSPGDVSDPGPRLSSLGTQQGPGRPGEVVEKWMGGEELEIVSVDNSLPSWSVANERSDCAHLQCVAQPGGSV